MRRALIINGLIAALALGTLGVVWATRDAPTTGELTARKSKLLGSWDKAGVSRIRLSRGGQRVELVRDASVGVEGDFRIVKPWQERADIATVNALLGSLDLASSLRSAEGVDRKLAGLERPLLEISLEMSGKIYTLKLGGPAPTPSGARYLEASGGDDPARVVLVSSGVVSELDVPFDKLREPRLLSLEQRELASLTITHAAGRVELVQQRPSGGVIEETGRVFFVKRGGARELADREAVLRAITGLSRLVASQFVEPEQARAALAQDATAIHVNLELIAKAGPPITLTLGAACPSAPDQKLAMRETARGAARAGCVPADVVEALRLVESQVALETPFAARVDEVVSISISSQRPVKQQAHSITRLDLLRKDTAFQLRSPSEAAVSLEAGNERIQAIVRARVTRPSAAQPDAGFGRGGYVSISTVAHEDQLASERIMLGTPRPDGSRCLKRDLDDVVLCVDAEAAKAFLPDPTLLRGSTVTSFAAADAKQLSIESPGLRQTVVRRDDGSFTLEEPEGFSHDGALVTDLVQTLGSLHAERWVAPLAKPEHGLENPRLRARVTMVGPAVVHELMVGAPTNGGYFAQLFEAPGVFVLARSTVDALEAPLIDRSLSPLPPEKLAAIELTQASRSLKLVKAGDSFTSANLAPARVAQLVETLRSLRADFTVHLGAERANERLRPPSLAITFSATSGERYVLRVGARDTIDGARIAYARLDSVNATFALAAGTLAALQDF